MIKKCDICGTTFETQTKQKYCCASCKKIATKMAKIRFEAKQRAQNTASVQVATPVIQSYTKPVVQAYTKPVVQTTEVKQSELDYITRSLNALKNLDSARRQIQDIIDVLKIEQAKYNKEDFDFAHLVEGSGCLSDTQRLKAWDDYAKTRNKRRNVKDIIKTLIAIIRYTPYNSEKIMRDALQNKIKVDDFFKDYYKQRGV